ncbi:hypothetical protein OX459_28005 [Janthinobacterium sp. SUN026]|uniref:hypothetical protein n=1 Tax=Janthinobacterium sp. SUN026 TaxID=3002438 RepID=UPI0025B0A3B3|nr:hypothetical protein [Janthinobacterium sp. SUN026]MDN2675247.1 hypothetical protein [Janthinobacterium sp. SUN026]
MLILLDLNIAEAAHELSEDEVDSLDDLLLCHFKLYHYVGAAKRVASILIEKLATRLTKRSLQTLRLISDQSSELTAIIRSSKFHAIVRRSDVAGVTTNIQGLQHIWICDLQYASKWFSQPSTLIGEHLVDTKILKVAATDVASGFGISRNMQRLNCEMSGGCGNAWEVLKNRIESALCPVLCIIDSDKYLPNVAPNPAVEKCHKVINEMNGISSFFEIEPREIENLLPDSLLAGAISMLPNSPDRDEIEVKYRVLMGLRKRFPVIYRHVDIKEGTCRTWVNKKNVQDFFKPIGIVDKCECQKDCEGVISPALFKDVLAKTVEFTDSQSPAQLQKFLKNEERPAWLELGQIVMSFSFANGIRVM